MNKSYASNRLTEEDNTQKLHNGLTISKMILVTTIVLVGILLKVSDANHQCVDAKNVCQLKKQKSPNIPSGTYLAGTVFGNIIEVYCDMQSDGGGYTFINPTFLTQLTNDEVQFMFTNRTSFLFCYRKKNSTQYCAVLNQLPQYSNISLKVGLNDYTGYTTTYNVNNLELPYLYFGFLPVSVAAYPTVQGLQVNGVNLSFTNCDSNPNSFIALFPNFAGLTPSSYHQYIYPFCYQIFSNCVQRTVAQYLPDYFFTFAEFTWGGCGCYTQSNRIQDVVGVAIGFR